MQEFAVGESYRYGSLRSLREADVPGMLEWMRDPAIAGVFQADFTGVDENLALDFVRSSWRDARSLHFAIADERDEYMGTISLKNVDYVNGGAEYAISTRSCAHGTGLAAQGTRDVVAFAFDELGLHRVYLNVRADNARAIRFYEKVGFVREGVARQALKSRGAVVDLVWYSILAGEVG